MCETPEIDDLRRRALARYLAAEGPTETYRARCLVRMVDALDPYIVAASEAEDAFDDAQEAAEEAGDALDESKAACPECDAADEVCDCDPYPEWDQSIATDRAVYNGAIEARAEVEVAYYDARDALTEAVALVEAAFDADDAGLRRTLEALGARDNATLSLSLEVA